MNIMLRVTADAMIRRRGKGSTCLINRTFSDLFLVAVSLCGGSCTVNAQSGNPDFWVPNDAVRAVLSAGNTVYIGGEFTYVGPNTGGGVVLDSKTGSRNRDFPLVAGSVSAAISDRMGGWYIGGQFASVGGVPRANIAHMLADGQVTAWNPVVTEGAVNDLALAADGSTVYVAGEFTSVGGQSRNNIAAIDATTGVATAWNPDIAGPVHCLALSGATVYAGGGFWMVGGNWRYHIVAIDATTGAATAWDPNPNGAVVDLAISGTTVYAVGYFTGIGGQARNHIAAVDAGTGAATAWDPNASGYVYALAVKEATVYVGGSFSHIGGRRHHAIAALDALTGDATDWDPGVTVADGDPEPTLQAVTVEGSTVYFGGYFASVGGQSRRNIAAVDAATGVAEAWDPNAESGVLALAVSGTSVYAGGFFTSMGGQTRNHIAALDAFSGSLTDWNPDIPGFPVYTRVRALAMQGSTIYVGGEFASIGGQERRNTAAIDARTGAVMPWVGNANGAVHTLVVSGEAVHAGGQFTSIGGETRNHLAALDALTGAATSWNPNITGTEQQPNSAWVDAIAVSDTTVYVGGAFGKVGGQIRSNIAAIDVRTGIAIPWNPDANSVVDAIALSGTTVYAGGRFSKIGGQTRFQLAALDRLTGTATDWNPEPTSPDYRHGIGAIAADGATVYVAGGFTSIGGRARNNIAALDATTAVATPWNPDASPWDQYYGGSVLSLVVEGNAVYAGGAFKSIGGRYEPYFAALSTTHPTPVALEAFASSVSGGGVSLRWHTPYETNGFLVDRREVPPPPEEFTRISTEAVRADAEGDYEFIDSSIAIDAQYEYRLIALGIDGTTTTLGPFFVSTMDTAPKKLVFASPAPNPSRGDMTLRYGLPRTSPVRLEVFSVDGRHARTLIDVGQDAGYHTETWNGRDDGGRDLPAGMYFFRLDAAGQSRTAKALRIR